MVSYFPSSTLLKNSNWIPDNLCQKVVRQFGESHIQWLIHQITLSALNCGNFEFENFLSEV